MVKSEIMNIKEAIALIRPIPDYPKPGILFQDISPLLAHPRAFSQVITEMSALIEPSSLIAGIEARGFILGSAIAHKNGSGFIQLRKAGKLPSATYSRSYGLEYGHDKLEIQQDAFVTGTHVTVVDDVLATGGTLEAGIQLVRDAGGIVDAIVALMEISPLGGRANLAKKFPELALHVLVTI